jgi:hypothetical protein
MLAKEVRLAFVRSASRFLPDGTDLSGLFEVFSVARAGNISAGLSTDLEERYPSLPVWPWDGQVSLLLMGWVMGAGFRLEGFRRAALGWVPDFLEMSRQCVFQHRGHTGVISLGDRCQRGFRASAIVAQGAKRREKFYCNW